MKIFSLAGLSTAILGIFLLSSHTSGNISSIHLDIVNIHIAFGFFGFAFILVMGVAFQVIPMFYVAKDFPKSIRAKFPRLVLGMLILLSIFILSKQIYTPILTILSSLAIIFAIYGLNSLNNRRRNVFDVTLWYWKLSLNSLILGLGLFISDVNNEYIVTITLILIFGFLYSLLQGMIYKIVPFLSWFHLNSKGYFDIPTIRGFIKEFDIKVQFYIYVSSILFIVYSTFSNQLFLYIGAVLFIVSNLLFIINLIKAVISYKNIAKEPSPMEVMMNKR